MADPDLLAIDIGNSNVHLGLFEGQRLIAKWRLKTDTSRQPDDYGAMLSVLLSRQEIDPTSVRAAVLGSVVPPLLSVFESVLTEYCRVDPVVVRTGTRTGIRVVYEPPFELGADRIAHAVAAKEICGTPAIVVDFGTATTFDAVGQGGTYLGGAIAPGLSISADALWQRTAQLRRINLTFPEHAVGRNTVEAVQSGLMFGHVGLVREMIRRIRAELHPEAVVIATGEPATLVGEQVPEIDHVDEDLTLQGLRLIHALNLSQTVA